MALFRDAVACAESVPVARSWPTRFRGLCPGWWSGSTRPRLVLDALDVAGWRRGPMHAARSAAGVTALAAVFSHVPQTLRERATRFGRGDALVGIGAVGAPQFVRFDVRTSPEYGGDVGAPPVINRCTARRA